MGGMAKFTGLLVLLGASFCCAQTIPQPQPKRLYIEERIKTTTGNSVHCDTYGNCFGHEGTNSRNVSLEVTREVVKQCPSVLTVTDNRGSLNMIFAFRPAVQPYTGKMVMLPNIPDQI